MSSMSFYDYWEILFKLIRPMFGTASEASIWDQHVLEKGKKEVQRMNKLLKKIGKFMDEITEQKEIEEIKGCIRAIEAVVGEAEPLPDDKQELLEYGAELSKTYETMIEAGLARKATIFMKGADGWPIISTHMILGNLKENSRIVTNNSVNPKKTVVKKGKEEVVEDKFLKSKAASAELFALDIKAVDRFMRPDRSIMLNEKGERELYERPLHFDVKGMRTSAIASSEQLPIDTEFGTILRIRKDSIMNSDKLHYLFSMGRNNGLGCWRGSGNMGAYVYKLRKLTDYVETIPKGWS